MEIKRGVLTKCDKNLDFSDFGISPFSQKVLNYGQWIKMGGLRELMTAFPLIIVQLCGICDNRAGLWPHICQITKGLLYAICHTAPCYLAFHFWQPN